MEIFTGYEKYHEDSSQIHIPMSIDYIEVCMRDRDPEKYGNFDEVLAKVEKALKYMMIPQYKKRAKLFDLVYHAMRLVDDVVDGDTQPPLDLDVRKVLMESIIEGNTETIRNPLYKAMLVEIQKLSQELGIHDEMMKGIGEIIISMNFDLERILDTNKTRLRNDLQENFHRMDIVGTIAGTALIFGIKPQDAIKYLSPLGEACRIMYNLRDFGEDIVADLINIPMENLQDFRIQDSELDEVKAQGKKIDYTKLPDSIKNWMRQEVRKIDRLLGEHTKNLQYNLPFADKRDILCKYHRNWIMKNLVLPKTYTDEIHERIPVILDQIGNKGLVLEHIYSS